MHQWWWGKTTFKEFLFGHGTSILRVACLFFIVRRKVPKHILTNWRWKKIEEGWIITKKHITIYMYIYIRLSKTKYKSKFWMDHMTYIYLFKYFIENNTYTINSYKLTLTNFSVCVFGCFFFFLDVFRFFAHMAPLTWHPFHPHGIRGSVDSEPPRGQARAPHS